MLHLHGFQHNDRRAGRNRVAGLGQYRDHAAVHRRAQLAVGSRLASLEHGGVGQIVHLRGDTVKLEEEACPVANDIGWRENAVVREVDRAILDRPQRQRMLLSVRDPEHVAALAPHGRLDDMAIEIESQRNGITMRQRSTVPDMHGPDGRNMNQQGRDRRA